MDVQQPWLAEFIKSGLGAWFDKLGGTPTDQYSFRKVDDVLRFTQTTKNARTVRLLKLPPLGIREPRGEVSDGVHTIEAVFPSNNATALLQAGAQTGTILCLADPVIRVTAHVNPPKPLLEFDRWEIADDKCQVPGESPIGVPVMQEEAVLDSMSRYGTVKSHNCGASNPMPDSSPRSIVSQAPFEPRNHTGTDDEDEEDLSQRQFYTQPTVAIDLAGPAEPARSSHRADSKSANDVELLQPFQKREMKPCSNASSSPAARRTTDPTPLPSLAISPHSTSPSSSGVAHVALNQDDHENSSPIETTELVAHVNLSAQPLQTSKGENQTHECTGLGPASPVSHYENIDAPAGSLQGWRLLGQGRRYVPRYVSKIPPDQENFLTSLLESGDSWQPPLVGHVHRPGQVPLTLLKQLCDAADKQAQNPVAPPSHATAVSPPVQESPSSPRVRSETTPDAVSNVEGASQAAVEWSRSPSTPRRRRKLAPVELDEDGLSESAESQDLSPSPPAKHQITALPQSSPPVDLRGNRQIVGLESIRGSPGLNGRFRQGMPVNEDGEIEEDELDVRCHNVSPRTPSRISELHVECTPSVTQTPLSVRSVDVGAEDRRIHTTSKPSTSSRVMGNCSTKKVQVERTPYPGNGTALFPRPGGEGINNEAPLSSVVPGTYTSLTSGEVPSSEEASVHPEAALTVKTAKARAPGIVSGSAAADTPSHAEPSKTNQGEANVKSTEQPTPLPVSLAASVSQRSPQNRVQAVISSDPNDMGGPGVQSHNLSTEQTRVGDRDQAESVTRQTDDEDVSQHPVHPDGPVNEVILAPTATGSSPIPVSVKRKRDDSRGSIVQTKRQRRSLQTSPVDADPVISEGRRTDSRGKLQANVKRQSPLRRPSSSSLDVDSSSRLHDAPLSIAEQPRMLASTINTRPSSTPVTRQSTYSGVWHIEDKARRVDSASLHSLAAEAASSERELFSKYCAAYPDYEGDADDFLRSYHFIQGVLNDEPNRIHSSLLDDAVFHHYYSYPPYKEAMGFIKFFNECVEDPSHHKRIIKLAVAERLPSHNQVRRSTFTANSLPRAQPSSDPRSALASGALPTPLAKRKQQQVLVPTNSDPPATAALSQESIDCIEKWRENAAPRVSPELGTTDIDRSLLPTSGVEKPASFGASPALPSKIRHLPQPLERPALAPTPTPKPPGSNRKGRSPASTAQAQLDPSAKSFMRPQPPSSAVKARSATNTAPNAFTSQAAEGERSRKWFTETNTAFIHFEKEYVRLYKEKNGKDVVTKARSSAPSRGVTGMGIDIFSWRK